MIIITSSEDRSVKCDGCGALPAEGQWHHVIMASDRYHEPSSARRFLGTLCPLCAVWTGRQLSDRAIDSHAGRISNAWDER